MECQGLGTGEKLRVFSGAELLFESDQKEPWRRLVARVSPQHECSQYRRPGC